MQTLEIKQQNKKALLLILAVPIVLGGYYYLFGGISTRLLILGGVVLAVLPFTIKRLLNTEPVVIVSDAGILDKRQPFGLIEWQDIKSAFIYEQYGNPLICLDLHDSKKYTARLTKTNQVTNSIRMPGVTPVHINASLLEIDADELCNLIVAQCEQLHHKSIQ